MKRSLTQKEFYYIIAFLALVFISSFAAPPAYSDQHEYEFPMSKETITITCDAPTTRVDGSSITATELVLYKLYRGAEQVAEKSECPMTVPLIKGKSIYSMTATDLDGNESDLSDTVKVTGIVAKPNKPTNLKITVE